MKSIFAFLLITLSVPAFGQVFVDQNATGSGDGSSWENAYTKLDEAIHATEAGEIWVTAGTYVSSTDKDGNVPNDPVELTFLLKNNIQLYGGFSGTESTLEERDWVANKTILSGDALQSIISSENVNLSTSTVLDGFTVQFGSWGIKVVGTGDTFFTIKNCTIKFSVNFEKGGGIYISDASPIIEDNVITENRSWSGAGIYLINSESVIRRNTIIDNQAYHIVADGRTRLGGGVYVEGNSVSQFLDNLIIDNRAESGGGGVYLGPGTSSVLSGNKIIENRTDPGDFDLGGGIYVQEGDIISINNVIANNYAPNGGGIVMESVSFGRIVNNTIAKNTARSFTGVLITTENTMDIKIVNSILYANESACCLPPGFQLGISLSDQNFSPGIYYSAIEDSKIFQSIGPTVTDQIYLEDPFFLDPDNGNFNLNDTSHRTSPLMDKGTLSSNYLDSPWMIGGLQVEFPDTDILGNPRVFNGDIDLGAYEIQELITGLDNKDPSISGIAIYPNPATTDVLIRSDNWQIEQIRLLSLTGKEVMSIQNVGRRATLSVASLKRGLYLVEVNVGKRIMRQKILVTN